MAFVEFAVAVVHILVAAIWLGAMSYSIAVVQPRAARLLAEERYEELAATLASGARWTVLAMCAVLAASGAGLTGFAVAGERVSTGWTAVIIAKVVLLLLALAVFAYVSWRLWPERVFALPAELPRLHQMFRRAAYTLIAVVGAEVVLGVAARTLLAR